MKYIDGRWNGAYQVVELAIPQRKQRPAELVTLEPLRLSPIF